MALAAGSQSAWVHDVRIELGARVSVVPPAKLRLIAESRRKTDRVDARLRAERARRDLRVAWRRGRKTAIAALARKLLRIAYRLLRDETVYDPARVGMRAA